MAFQKLLTSDSTPTDSLLAAIKQCILGTDLSVVAKGLESLSKLLPDIDQAATLVSFDDILDRAIDLLGQLRPDVNRNAGKVLAAISRLPNKLDTVITKLIEQGLTNTSWHVRQQTIKTVASLIEGESGYLQNAYEAKSVYEAVLDCVNDDSAIVSLAAKDAIKRLDGINPAPADTVKRLPYAQQKIYNDNCADYKPGVSASLTKLQISQTARLSSGANRTVQMLMPITERNADKHPRDAFGRAYGFIPPGLMQQMCDSNWRQRVQAASEVEQLFRQLHQNFDGVLPYLPPFATYLKTLLLENNFKMNTSILGIIHELARYPTISHHVSLAELMEPVAEKLGENRISIRKSAAKIFHEFLKEISTDTLFTHCLENLNHKNWHIREEILQIFITALLSINTAVNYDFVKLVLPVARMLDDEKAKIRFVAQETLACLAHICGKEVVKKMVRPVVDNSTFAALKNRVKNSALPVLRDGYIEFPRFVPVSVPVFSQMSPVKQLQRRRRAVSRSSVHGTTPSLSTYDNYSSEVSLSTEDSGSRHDERRRSIPLRRQQSSSAIIPHQFKLPKIQTSVEPERMQPKAMTRRFRATQPDWQDHDDSPTLPTDLSSTAQSSRLNTGKKKRTTSLSASSTPIKDEGPLYLKVSEISYLKQDEVDPVSNPDQELLKLLSGLKCNEWIKQFEALNMLRRLVRHHKQVFTSPDLFHNLILDVQTLVLSLRSSLSKNALILISELAIGIPHMLDLELPFIVPRVMKKCVDTASFLSEEAETALLNIAKHCNESKVASQLLQLANSTDKSARVKAKIALCVQVLIERLGSSIVKLREIGMLVMTVQNLLGHASSYVRAAARKAVRSFGLNVDQQTLDKVLRSSLNDSQMQKMVSVAFDTKITPHDVTKDELRKNSTLETPRKSSKTPLFTRTNRTTDQMRATQEPFSPTVQQPKKPRISPPKSASVRLSYASFRAKPVEIDEFEKLREQQESKEWRTRYQAIHEASVLAVRSQNQDAVNVTAMLECFANGISDMNLKVNIHSLSALLRIIPLYQSRIDLNIGIILAPLGNAAGASNSSIRNMARDVFACLLEHCPATTLINPLVNACVSSNQRAKPVLLGYLSTVINQVYQVKPQLITKALVSTLMRVVEDKKMDVRVAFNKLLQSIYDCMGFAFLDLLPADKIQMFLNYVNKH